MDFLAAVIIFVTVLIASVIKGSSIIYPLIAGLVLFIICALYRGHKPDSVFKMGANGAKTALTVIKIFVLIGMITSIWRASGTIPYFVYHGIHLINPKYFILWAFILSCAMSFTIGTSLGTAGTIGVVLIILSESAGVNTIYTAGAVLSGAYFGDRCSPTSSSANLVAVITGTSLRNNIKNMMITGILPFAVTACIYFYLSVQSHTVAVTSTILKEIETMYTLTPILALPVVIMLTMILFKSGVKISMAMSIASAFIIALTIQKADPGETFKSLFFGYTVKSSGEFASIITGGGIISMLKVSVIVLISSAYSGIFDGANMLKEVKILLKKISLHIGIFPSTILSSVVTAALTCNQALCVMLTGQLMNDIYGKTKKDASRLAVDLENTAIVIPPLIPWNIAVAVPLTILNAPAVSIFFAFFLYLTPALNMIKTKIIYED